MDASTQPRGAEATAALLRVRASHRRLGRPLHDLRISVTDRCNFRCTYCMPKEIFGRDYAFLPQGPGPVVRGDPACRAGVRRSSASRSCASPAANRSSGAACRTLIGMLAELRTPDGARARPHADDEWRRAAGAGRAAGRRRPAAGHGQPRLARRRGVRRDERDRLPGRARSSTGSTPPSRPGSTPVKINMVVRRGINEGSIVPMARWARETGVIAAVHRVHGRRAIRTAGGSTRSCPRPSWSRRSTASVAGRAGRARAIAARSPAAGATSTARGEFGVISSVTQPFCRDCTRARLSADGKLYTCLFAVAGRDVRAVLRDGSTDDELRRVPRRRPGGPATTAIPSCGSAATADLPQGRDVRDGRLTASRPRRSSTGLSTRRPQPSELVDTSRAVGAMFVDKRVDPSPTPADTVGLARRGRQDRRNRDHIKGLRSAAGRFGRFVARVARPSHHGPSRGTRPTGRDRHPGVDTSVGRDEAAGLGRLPPGRVSWRPASELRCRRRRPRSTPRRPIPPGRPARAPGGARRGGPRADRRSCPRSGSCWGRGSAGSPTTSRTPSRSRSRDLPGWPAATAPGHVGRLLLGRLGGRPVVMLQGRFHLYEGNDPGLVVQPVLLFQALGARIVVLTNAAGGLDPSFGPGTLMVMRDHINLTGRNPLIGPNADELGPRFPDMTEAWSPRLRDAPPRGRRGRGRRRCARAIYVGLTGPTYETPGRGPDARGARRRRGRDVDGARVHRRALGRPRGLRRVARDQRRRRVHAASR